MGQEILILGAGGHAKVVIDALLSVDPEIRIVLYDDDPNKICLTHYPVVGNGLDLVAAAQVSRAKAIVTIGQNKARADQYHRLAAQQVGFGQAVHARASIAPSVKLGAGVMIMAAVVINPDAGIGNNVIINTGAIVEHDCMIADHCHIAPNVTLCGAVSIDQGTLVGAGTVVLPNVKIGKNVVIGAGSVILEDIPDGVKVVGHPGKVIGSANVW